MRLSIPIVCAIASVCQIASAKMIIPKHQLSPVPDGVEFDFERWPYPLYEEIV